jgi:hypothetical protein
LAEAEIKEKVTKDSDFAIYMKSLDLESKGESTENVSSLQGN